MVTRSQSALFAQLIAEHESNIRRAFMASVTDLQANVDWPLLLASLEAGNIERAIGALNINEAAWAQYSAAVSATYAASGSAYAAQIKQAGIGSIGTRFNMMNPRAEAWIRENVGESIVGYVREQIDAARTAIVNGYAKGMGPRNIALDLVGRSTGGGARSGGILGLDNPRAERLNAVIEGMKTPEGVQSLVIRHNNGALSVRYKVNLATERRILSAYTKGEAVSVADRAISETQYRNALLKSRADTVAETEVGNAVAGAREEEWRQVMDAEGIRPDQIKKTWRHGRGVGGESRITHVEMNGEFVIGFDTPFVLSDGSVMQYAHDLAGGAKNNIRCGCQTEYTVVRRVD